MKLAGTALAVVMLLSGCAGLARVADREPDQTGEKDALLAEAQLPHVVVREAFVSAATPADNIDSPASWRDADGRLRVAATAKSNGTLVIYDGETGQRLRTVAGKGTGLGQLNRPNGIATVDGYAWVVERDNHRVQMFQLPDFRPLLVFGGGDLQQPYGLWVNATGQGYEVFVSDNYMSPQDEDRPPPLAQLDKRFRRFLVQPTAAGWQATLAGSFGDTSAAGAIRIAESLWGDPEHGRLLIAEEDVATGTRLREYDLQGRYRGRDVGEGVYGAQAEGITLMRCAGGTGFWIGSDQFKDRTLFHVFDRQTLQHQGSFAGAVTANTDGIWLEQDGRSRFPAGVLYAIHDDQALAAFDWRDVQSALQLQECQAG